MLRVTIMQNYVSAGGSEQLPSLFIFFLLLTVILRQRGCNAIFFPIK